MMTKRTDIHRPSAAEFDPESYNLFGVFDLNPDEFFGAHERVLRRQAIETAKSMGYRFASHQHTGQCGHCGAHIRYAALMLHEASHEMIYVGETCLDGRFEMTKGEFDRLRKQAKLDREKQRLLTAFRTMCENQSLAYATYAFNIEIALEREGKALVGDGFDAIVWAGLNWNLNTLQDIMTKARRYGSISEKQTALVERLVAEQDAKWSAFVVKQQARNSEKESADQVQAGRYEFSGEVVALKEVEDNFSYYPRTILKMTVKLAGGQRLYGTVPSAIEVNKGDMVRLTATVEASSKDPSFGFFKRPAKASVEA